MEITSSLMFYFLSQKYQIHIVASKLDNIPVATIRPIHALLDLQTIESGFYVATETSILKNITTEKCVFLFLCEPNPINLPINCNAAFLQTSDSMDQVIFETSEITRKLLAFDSKLMEYSNSKTNLSNLLTIIHEVFPYPLAIVDRNYIVSAFSPNGIDETTFKKFTQISPTKLKANLSVITDLLLEPAFAGSLKKKEAFLYPQENEETLLCMNIFENNQYLARILCTIGDDYSPGISCLFTHLCSYIKTVFLNYTDDILVIRQNDMIHTLLHNLILNYDKDKETIENISEVLSAYGWESNHKYTVAILRFENIEEFNHIYFYLCNQLEMQWIHSYAIKAEKEIVWIINNDLCNLFSRAESLHQPLSYILRDMICKAGISDSVNDINKIHLLYEHAIFALESGSTINKHFWYFYFDDYKLNYISKKIRPTIQNENLYHKGILQLIEYDKKKSTNLVTVLTAFISNNFNASIASDKLFMHRSTFNRQMQKIEQLTGINWHAFENIDDVIYALITLKLLEKL